MPVVLRQIADKDRRFAECAREAVLALPNVPRRLAIAVGKRCCSEAIIALVEGEHATVDPLGGVMRRVDDLRAIDSGVAWRAVGAAGQVAERQQQCAIA
ncbi:hypothetical protein D3C81_1573750 [compost metagenome]